MRWVFYLLQTLFAWLVPTTGEAPSEDAWERFSTLRQSILERITREDADSTYALNMIRDDIDASPLGELRHVANITSTMQSVLRIVEDPSGRQFVAKFVSDCRSKYHGRTEDSNLAEYSFQAALNDTGLAPKVYFLSPPAPIVRGFPMKARSGLMIKSTDHCIDLKSELRMTVMQIVGQSVDAYLKWFREQSGSGAAYFRAVMHMTLKTLRLIESLHSHGVVHGDIHGGNIVFRDGKPMQEYDMETDELMLIDFGMASFFPDQHLQSDHAPTDTTLNVLMLTPWQLLDKRYGRRDDLYKILDYVAHVLSGDRLGDAFEDLHRRIDPRPWAPFSRSTFRKACQRYRSKYSLFTPNRYYELGCCVVMEIGAQKRRSVQTTLETVVMHVKAIPHPDDEPDYAFISGALRFILQSA